MSTTTSSELETTRADATVTNHLNNVSRNNSGNCTTGMHQV